MSANNGEAGPRLPVLRDCEGEQGTLVPNGGGGETLSPLLIMK